MTYGTIKVDTVTFTDAGVDKSVTLSGLVQNPTFSGNVTVTGTLSGVTVTGTTANFTSGNFTNISGGTHTITSGVFAAGSAASPSITFTGDLNTGIYSPGADQVAISTGGSGRLFVDASGNVGVATGAPSYRLEVNGTISQSSQGTSSALIQAVNAGGIFYHGLDNSAGTTFGQAYAAALWHSGAYPILFATNGTERLRITSAGLVGIGTSAPSDPLHIAVSGANSANIRLQSGDGRTYNIGSTGSGYGSSGKFIIYDITAGAERFCINSSGNVGIGTSSPSGLLHVAGQIYSSGTGYTGTNSPTLRLINSTATTGRTFGINSADSGIFQVFDASAGDATRLCVDSSGRLGIGTTSPGVLLDVAGGNSIRVQASSSSISLPTGLALTTGFGVSYLSSFDGSGNAVDFGGVSANFIWSADTHRFTNRPATTEYARIDSSGRVGIGTSSPAKLLEVNEGDIQIRNSSTASINTLLNYGLAFRSTNQIGQDRGTIAEIKPYLGGAGDNDFGLQFRTQATTGGGVTTKMTLTPGGSLGIGTTSADARLTVQDGTNNIARVKSLSFDNYANEGIGVAFGRTSDGADVMAIGVVDTDKLMAAGREGILFATGGGGLYSAATERARIDSSGRLLVGTSSARGIGRLQIEGTDFTSSQIAVTRNSNDAFESSIVLNKTRGTGVGGTTIVNSGDTLGVIYFTGSDGTNPISTAAIGAVVDGTPGINDMPGRLVFSTTADGASSPTERMRITNSGDLLVDSTSSGARLTLRTATDGAGLGVYVNSNNATQRAIFVYSDAAVADTFRIYSNGNAVNTNSSYGAISDIRLKENIVDANSQWDDIKNLQVRNYNLKEGQAHKQIGLIAQEAELVSPGLVYETPDFDAEGNDLGTTTKVVQYSVLYMKAVKALQEAMERIETLEAKVAALESA